MVQGKIEKINKTRNWKICLDPHAPSDRAYNIAFTCSGATEKIDLKNVLFGDVYICSGQSNMEFTVSKLLLD